MIAENSLLGAFIKQERKSIDTLIGLPKFGRQLSMFGLEILNASHEIFRRFALTPSTAYEDRGWYHNHSGNFADGFLFPWLLDQGLSGLIFNPIENIAKRLGEDSKVYRTAAFINRQSDVIMAGTFCLFAKYIETHSGFGNTPDVADLRAAYIGAASYVATRRALRMPRLY